MGGIGVSVLKSVTWILILASILLANDTDKIKNQIITELGRILTQKENPNICILNDSNKAFFLQLNKTKACKKADIAFVSSFVKYKKLLNHSIPVIALSYREYLRYNMQMAGAFFWQKGRPNIIIRDGWIQKNKIVIPLKYRHFIE